MQKKYEEPKIDIVLFQKQDVIVASGDQNSFEEPVVTPSGKF